MAFIEVTGPESEPVTVDEAKLALRVDGSDLDAELSMLIQSAREAAEHETGRALMPKVLRLELVDWPAVLVIGCAPVQSVASVQYWDGAVWQTINGTQYTAWLDGLLWRIDPVSSWPVLGAGVGPRVRVQFNAGYEDAAAVPASIKRWIIAHAGAWLQQPEAAGQKLEVNPLLSGLLDPHRLYL